MQPAHFLHLCFLRVLRWPPLTHTPFPSCRIDVPFLLWAKLWAAAGYLSINNLRGPFAHRPVGDCANHNRHNHFCVLGWALVFRTLARLPFVCYLAVIHYSQNRPQERFVLSSTWKLHSNKITSHSHVLVQQPAAGRWGVESTAHTWLSSWFYVRVRETPSYGKGQLLGKLCLS